MDILFLGTGSGLPSKQRNVSSLALQLLQETGTVWLFDCGEATQHQIMQTPLKPRKIEKIFITHLHGDHIFGLPGLLSSRAFQGGTAPVELYGPAGLKDYIETSLRVSGTHLPFDVLVTEIYDGWNYKDKNFFISAKKLDHGIPSYGFRIEEKNRLGELDPEKLKQEGIKPGPIYQKIKNNPYTELEDGRIIARADFLGPEKTGKIITILGDTRYLEDLSSFVRNSDVLVHEATFRNSDHELAYNYHHSTTVQAATLAHKSKVKRLILNHISSRYQGETVTELLHEARTIHSNTDMAYDFYKTTIT